MTVTGLIQARIDALRAVLTAEACEVPDALDARGFPNHALGRKEQLRAKLRLLDEVERIVADAAAVEGLRAS